MHLFTFFISDFLQEKKKPLAYCPQGEDKMALHCGNCSMTRRYGLLEGKHPGWGCGQHPFQEHFCQNENFLFYYSTNFQESCNADFLQLFSYFFVK